VYCIFKLDRDKYFRSEAGASERGGGSLPLLRRVKGKDNTKLVTSLLPPPNPHLIKEGVRGWFEKNSSG